MRRFTAGHLQLGSALLGCAAVVLGAEGVLKWLRTQGGVAQAAVAPQGPMPMYGWGHDGDGDGIDDTHELVLGTIPESWDSDGDGYSDLMEIVLRSDPRSAFLMPNGLRRGSYSAMYRASQDSFRVAFYLYEPAGVDLGHLDRWGLLYRGLWTNATQFLAPFRYREVISPLGAAAPGGACIFEVGYEIPAAAFASTVTNDIGWHVYFSMSWGGEVHSGMFNLRNIAGMLVETLFVPGRPPQPQGGGSGGSGGTPSFAAFRPFDVQTARTQGWIPGRACYLVLGERPYVRQPEMGLAWYVVNSTSCEPAAYALCAPDCTSNLKNQLAGGVRVLDPFALAGL